MAADRARIADVLNEAVAHLSHNAADTVLPLDTPLVPCVLNCGIVYRPSHNAADFLHRHDRPRIRNVPNDGIICLSHNAAYRSISSHIGVREEKIFDVRPLDVAKQPDAFSLPTPDGKPRNRVFDTVKVSRKGSDRRKAITIIPILCHSRVDVTREHVSAVLAVHPRIHVL